MFKNTFNLIDQGGAYRARDPINGLMSAPNYTITEAKEKFQTDKQMLQEVYRATPHPKFIRNLAQIFIKKYLFNNNGKFIGFHWRFDVGDFLDEDFMTLNATQMKVHGGITVDMFVEIQKSLKDVQYLFSRIVDHIEKNIKVNVPKTIFITSPIDVAYNLQKIGKSFKGYKIVTTIDTHKFLYNYRDCWVLD